MENNRRSRIGKAAKLFTASAIAFGMCGSVFAQSSGDGDTPNVRQLQDVLAGLQGLIGNVSAIAAQTPKAPGFYDKDASGNAISSKSVAGDSPNNIRLGVPNTTEEHRAVVANLPPPPLVAQAKPEALSMSKGPLVVTNAATTQPPLIAVKPAATVASVPSVTSPAPAATAPVVASVPPKPVALVVVVAPPTWAFKPNATMEETLASWANTSGWKTPQWKASLPATAYRIKEGDPVSGSFFDALQAMAAAVPQVDINVSPDSHELTVTDAKVKKVAQLP
jgi:hypothetical protein